MRVTEGDFRQLDQLELQDNGYLLVYYYKITKAVSACYL